MRPSEARDLSDQELEVRERDLKEELFRLRLRHGTAQLDNTEKLVQTRRDIARILTIRRERARERNRVMRGKPKLRQGVVTSNKMSKTVVVVVERLVRHPKYRKYLKQRNKFKAHDENDECGLGDTVEIIESRPISRDKRWRVHSILKKAV